MDSEPVHLVTTQKRKVIDRNIKLTSQHNTLTHMDYTHKSRFHSLNCGYTYTDFTYRHFIFYRGS